MAMPSKITPHALASMSALLCAYLSCSERRSDACQAALSAADLCIHHCQIDARTAVAQVASIYAIIHQRRLYNANADTDRTLCTMFQSHIAALVDLDASLDITSALSAVIVVDDARMDVPLLARVVRRCGPGLVSSVYTAHRQMSDLISVVLDLGTTADVPRCCSAQHIPPMQIAPIITETVLPRLASPAAHLVLASLLRFAPVATLPSLYDRLVSAAPSLPIYVAARVTRHRYRRAHVLPDDLIGGPDPIPFGSDLPGWSPSCHTLLSALHCLLMSHCLSRFDDCHRLSPTCLQLLLDDGDPMLFTADGPVWTICLDVRFWPHVLAMVLRYADDRDQVYALACRLLPLLPTSSVLLDLDHLRRVLPDAIISTMPSSLSSYICSLPASYLDTPAMGRLADYCLQTLPHADPVWRHTAPLTSWPLRRLPAADRLPFALANDDLIEYLLDDDLYALLSDDRRRSEQVLRALVQRRSPALDKMEIVPGQVTACSYLMRSPRMALSTVQSCIANNGLDSDVFLLSLVQSPFLSDLFDAVLPALLSRDMPQVHAALVSSIAADQFDSCLQYALGKNVQRPVALSFLRAIAERLRYRSDLCPVLHRHLHALLLSFHDLPQCIPVLTTLVSQRHCIRLSTLDLSLILQLLQSYPVAPSARDDARLLQAMARHRPVPLAPIIAQYTSCVLQRGIRDDRLLTDLSRLPTVSPVQIGLLLQAAIRAFDDGKTCPDGAIALVNICNRAQIQSVHASLVGDPVAQRRLHRLHRLYLRRYKYYGRA